jgi:ATP-binding cassette subfamily B protein
MTTKEYLSGLIGQFLSEEDLASLVESAEFSKPNPGLLLESISASDGLYILVAGKVRLVNSSLDLISTLHPAQLFGECTLFPEAGFLDYAVRVSPQAELCYIPGKVLRSIIHKNSRFKEYLYNLATAKDNEQKRKFSINTQLDLSVNDDQELIAGISTIKDEIYLKTHKQKVNKAGSSLPFMLNQHIRCQDNILLTQKFRKFLKP